MLGDAAHARGLYRDATQLHKTAAASGSPRAALYLSHPPDCLRADLRPAHWAAAHAPLDDPDDVARLLVRLREGGAGSRRRVGQPGSRPRPLDEPFGVALLLGWLREAGGQERGAALLAVIPPPTPTPPNGSL